MTRWSPLQWPVIRQVRSGDVLGRGPAVTSERTRTLAPRTWAPYAWLRGVGDHLVDAAFTRDPRLRRVIAALEARSAGG